MNNLKAKLKKQGGFTLIEMLIVVAIIAILIAIAIPMVNQALERAREATDAANERSALGVAMVEVMTENELAGVPIAGAAKSAWYKITPSGAATTDPSGMGTLVDGTGTKPADGSGGGYGKGTAAGDVPVDRTGKTIKVTYDPTAAEDAQWKVEWD